MAYNNIETALALETLRAPLDPYPVNNQEKFINDMRLKFRTYYLEYNGHKGATMLPSLFALNFGDDVPRVAILVDGRNNQFEVLVEKINDNVYLTVGWASLLDFYDLRLGGWLVLLYIGFGHFALTVYDAVQQEVIPPGFVPPMKFVIHKRDVPPHFVDNLPDSLEVLAYAHDPDFFHVEYEKTLTYNDVTNGFLVLPYDGFGELAFDKSTTSVKIIDDRGNVWQCMLIYVSFPWKHFKVGGEWSRLVKARRLAVGKDITLGVEAVGQNDTLYLTVDS